MMSDVPRRQTANGVSVPDPRRRRRSGRPGRWRRRATAFDFLESRRLLSVNIATFPLRGEGTYPEGIATGAGLDTNIWFTLALNHGNIGMINPNDPGAGVTQYPTPSYDSGPGAITAGPDGKYWFVESGGARFGAIDPSTGHITEIPLLTTTNPQVEGIAAGPNGTVWFTESHANQVGMIDTATDQITEFPMITPGAEPYGIVEGPDGGLWFTESGSDQVGRIDPTTHAIQEFPFDYSGADQAEGIAVGPDSNLWFTLTGADKIGVLNPTTGEMVAEYAVPTANARPNSIALGPANGSMWFTESGANQIAQISTTGTVTEVAAYGSGSTPIGLTSGPDGGIWYAESNQVGIEAYHSGATTSYPYSVTKTDAAFGIAPDSQGNLWFAQEGDNQVGMFDPKTDISTEQAVPTSNSGPLEVAQGPDPNMWFTEFGYGAPGHKIGTIDSTTGQITEKAVPTANAQPYDIVYDPVDGNLYFTEWAADKVGRINPITRAVSEYPIPTPRAFPESITVNSSGNIWFVEPSVKKLAELSPSDPSVINEYNVLGDEGGIVAGPDGNIWFSEVVNSVSEIAVFSPSSDTIIARYPAASALAMTVGPDDNIWFTDYSGYIGMITTAGVVTEYPVPNAHPEVITPAPDGNLWFTATGSTGYPNVIGVVTLSAASIPSQLAVMTRPPNTVAAGKGFGLVISVENAAGQPDPDYTGSVTIALARNPGGDTLQGTLTATVNHGVAVFPGLTLQDFGAGYTIQATAPGLTPVTTDPFDVRLGSATLQVTTQPPAYVGAGTSFGLTVSAINPGGDVDTSYNGPITLTLGDHPNGATFGGVLVMDATNGVATFSGLNLSTLGNYTIVASNDMLGPVTTVGFVVDTSPPTRLAIAPGGGPPASVLIDGSFDVSLVIEDGNGNTATDFNGSVTLALVNAGGVTLQGQLTENAAGGQLTFTELSIGTAGDYQIQATSDGLSQVTTNSIHVTAGAATQLVLAPGNPPSQVDAGADLGITVEAEDGQGHLDTTFAGTVVIGLVNAPGISLYGSASATAVGGVATFPNLSIHTVGTYILRATSTGLAAASSSSVVVVPAAPSQLAIQSEPTTATAGQVFATPLVIHEEDHYGNLETDDNSTRVTALMASGAGPLHGTISVAVTGGVATFADLSDNAADTITIGFSVGGLPLAVTNPIVVGPATVYTLIVQAQPSPTAAAGQAFATPPVIDEEDQYGNLETGDNATLVTAMLAEGTGPLQGQTTVTVSGGVARFSGLSDDRVETIRLDFKAGTLLTQLTNPIVVGAGPAAKLVIQAQPSTTATAGQPFASQPVIVEEDQYGNVEIGENTTVITASAAGPLQGTTTATVKGGVATFTGLAETTVGMLTLRFNAVGLSPAVANPVAVSSAPATRLVVTTPPPTLTARRPVLHRCRDRRGSLRQCGFLLQRERDHFDAG